MQLYHFACEHSARQILRDGVIKPSTTGYLKVSWWTDMAYPDRHALGLTSHALDCDRIDFRFTLTDPGAAVHWGRVRAHAPALLRDAIELVPGAEPARWWVTHLEVPAAGFVPVKSLKP